MDADQTYKDKIGQRLTETLLNAYEAQKISRDDVAYLATYIREEYIEQDHDSASIFAFIEELSREWPIFSNLLYEKTDQAPAPKEDMTQQIHNISSLIQETADKKDQHV